MEHTSTNQSHDELLDNLFLQPLADFPTVPTTDAHPDNTPIQPEFSEVVRTLRVIQQHITGLLNRLDNQSLSSSTVVIRPYQEMGSPAGATEKIIEGTFTGEKMCGNDGAEYSVPPNYASKSKLVTGDVMKLTITTSGAFIYKQIRQVERRRVVGALAFDAETKKWTVLAEDLSYRVLTASISFYRGQPGDEVVLLVPADRVSDWGAVDNIVHV